MISTKRISILVLVCLLASLPVLTLAQEDEAPIRIGAGFGITGHFPEPEVIVGRIGVRQAVFIVVATEACFDRGLVDIEVVRAMAAVAG